MKRINEIEREWHINLKEIKNKYHLIEEILHARGIEDIGRFLNPDESCLNDWNSLRNIEKAVELVHKAIENDQRIGILWDVDCKPCVSK